MATESRATSAFQHQPGGRAETPAEDLYLPYGHQAAIAACASVGLFAVAGGAMLVGEAGRVVVAAAGVLGAAAALFALIVRALAWQWEGQLRRTREGQYYVHWTYDDELWQQYLRTDLPEEKHLDWILAGALLLVGLGSGGLYHWDSGRIGDSIVLTYLLPGAVGSALGFLIGRLTQWSSASRFAKLSRSVGQCYIGYEGVYLTGQYWPWGTVGQGLWHVRLTGDQPAWLVFTFYVHTTNSFTWKDIRVPVPPGEEATAAEIAEKLTTHRPDE